MHIVLVNQWYPPEGWGGTATYAYHIARAYAALGHRVTVVTSSEEREFPERELSEGVEIRRIRALIEPSWTRRIPFLGWYRRTVRHAFYSWRVSRYLAKMQREEEIDVVEFPEVNAEGLHYVLRRRRPPVVIRCHSPHLLLKEGFTRQEAPFDHDLIWRLERFVIRRAAALTSPSRYLADRIVEASGIDPTKMTVVPYPVPVADEPTEVPEPRDGGVRVLHVGRLERSKGAFTLVRAVPLLVQEFPNLHVTLVGPTRMMPNGETVEAALRRILREHGCEGHVEFTGLLSKEDTRPFYQAATICALPNEGTYETFSYTCAEGMASGRPVVSCWVGAIPEVVVDGECGLLVEPADPRQLADAILRLARDPEMCRRMGAAGYNRVRTLYDPEIVAGRILDVYRSVRPGQVRRPVAA